MTQKIPISVFIIAQNEADRIPPAIRSVIDWVDEVIVIDGGSEDDTVEVSENLGARVEYKKWEGYGPQKAYGESLCRNQWILNVDADEEITDSLRDEIIALFTDGTPRYSAYKLPILPLYGFQSKGHAWTAHCKPVRLFDKNVCCFKSGFVHDSVIVPKDVDVGTFRGVVNHKSFRSLVHHVDKVNSHSTMQAEVLKESGRRTNFLTMFILPFFAFWKSYLLRREFVNGIDGVLTSHMYAFQRFIRYAKLREREYKKRDEQ
jgi:glycosyltransferase involved in cell wall biosynthesis